MLVSLMSFYFRHSLRLSFCLSPIGFSVFHGGADIYYLVLVLRDGTPLKVWGIGVLILGFPGLSKSEMKIGDLLLLYYFVYLCV